MNLFLRGFIVLLLLYFTLKVFNKLNESSETHLHFLSYLITLISVAGASKISHQMFKQIRQKREQSKFERQNTKVKWVASLSSPDELEYLMKKQKTLDNLIQKVKIAKQTAYTKEKFQTLLVKYIQTLKQKIDTTPETQKDKLNKQIQQSQKQLEISWLINEQQFSQEGVMNRLSLRRQQYLQSILELPISDDQKRQLIVNRFPYLVQFISPFLEQYIESSADLRPSFFTPLMFTPFQRHKIAQSVQNHTFSDQHQFYIGVIKNLVKQLHNYSVSLILLQQLLEIQEREASEEQNEMLFYLRFISMEQYESHKISVSWQSVIKQDKYSLFQRALDEMGTYSIDKIKSIYDQLDPTLFSMYLTKYTFNSKLNTKQIIDFFKLNYIQTNQKNIISFVQNLKSKTVDECYHYEDIVQLLNPFKSNPIVNQFLELLRYSRIFYNFKVDSSIRLMEELWLSQNQSLQDKALVIFRDMVKTFTINKMRSRYIDLDGQEFDLHDHQSIIKLSLYLKKNFFKRLLTEQTMYQMIFQHLIHFQRYGILKSLLSQDILEKYIIDYSMIEIVVIEQIHTLFSESNNYSKIEPQIQRLYGLLTQTTAQKASVGALINIAKLLKKNRLNVDPSNLIRNINSSILYTIANSKITIDREELYKLYKEILIFKNPSLEEPNTQTKEYRKFLIWLVKKYYKIGLQEEGYNILKNLSQYKMPQLCNTMIQLMQTHPGAVQSLLLLGYDQIVTLKQFQYFKKKFQQEKIYRQKDITDYKFAQTNLVSNQKVYSDVVAQSKFIDNSLKNPIFETFFFLIGNSYEQAFFNAYKKRLPFAQIDFFIKECIKKGIIETQKVVPWLFKGLIAKNSSLVFGVQTPYSQFIKELHEDFENPRSNFKEIYSKLEKSSEVDPVQKALIKKYYLMAQIRGNISDKFITKYIKKSDITKFFQDKAYRKKQITELASRVQEQDVVMLSKLAKIQQVNLLDLIIFHICGFLNSQKIPGNIQQYLVNTTLLAGKTIQGANNLMEKFVGKVFCTRILLSLIYGLMKLKDPFWKEYFKDKPSLRILETLAAVEQQSQFYGLLPNDFFSKKIRPSFSQQNLQAKKINILNNCLKLQNVFVVSKALYLVYGFSSSIQKQIYKILCDKSPEAARKLQKLLV